MGLSFTILYLPFVMVLVLDTKLLLIELINNKDDSSGFHGGEYEDGCLLGCCAV
jgi:hypothetical protein